MFSKPVPTFTWTIDELTGEVVATLNSVGTVHEARVWWAYSCGTNPDGVKRRDFRIVTLDQPREGIDKPYECECGIFDAKDGGYCANLKSTWSHETLTQEIVSGKRTYRANVPPPGDGRYVAFFIDISYGKPKSDKDKDGGFFPKDLAMRLQFTTEVSVMPNTFPYEGCGVDNPTNPCTDLMI